MLDFDTFEELIHSIKTGFDLISGFRGLDDNEILYNMNDMIEKSSISKSTQLGDSIALFWKLPAIQNTFECRHGLFPFPDNLDYFLNNGMSLCS